MVRSITEDRKTIKKKKKEDCSKKNWRFDFFGEYMKKKESAEKTEKK